MPDSHPPEVLMFLASGCAHCPAVLSYLSDFLKAGQISQLRAVNLASNTELAKQYNVRSVPWIKIGDFELSGAYNKQELLHWIEQASLAGSMASYYEELLNNGELQSAIDHIKQHPHNLASLLELVTEKDIKISVQIGIGAIMEEFANSDTLKALVPQLTELSQHHLPRVRNDACHFLWLSGDKSVETTIRKRLNDEDAEVRETAQDCLDDFA